MDLVGGGVDSRGGYVSKILYVKAKESGPVGGVLRQARPLDPPMGVHNMDYVLTGPAAAHRTPCKTFPHFTRCSMPCTMLVLQFILR